MTVAKQVRNVQRRLLEAAYGSSFPMLAETTQLSKAVLVDALELCDHDDDPAARVLALWRAWAKGGIGSDYETFPHYVRRRAKE